MYQQSPSRRRRSQVVTMYEQSSSRRRTPYSQDALMSSLSRAAGRRIVRVHTDEQSLSGRRRSQVVRSLLRAAGRRIVRMH